MSQSSKSQFRLIACVAIVLLMGLALWSYQSGNLAPWIAQAGSMLGINQVESSPDNEHSDEHGEHDDHDHDHGEDHDHDHDHATAAAPENAGSTNRTLKLSPQAMKNLGLTRDYLRPVELSSYQKSLTVPAVITGRSGRTRIQVSSPLEGVITHVHRVAGEGVDSGELLFEIRLSYENLVVSQTEFLKTIGELQVEEREIQRLESVAESGAVSGKVLLDRKYAKGKLDAILRSQREGLRLHGLSDRQIDEIASAGKLLRELQVVAPEIDEHSEDEELRLSQNPFRRIVFSQPGSQETPQDPLAPKAPLVPADEVRTPLVMDELVVQKGQAVKAGEKLCTLSDYRELYIEGHAFEQDIAAIQSAITQGLKAEAIFPDSNSDTPVSNLSIAFIENDVDPTTRVVSFYVEITNTILQDQVRSGGQRYITWLYRPGQRLQLKIPVEIWENQIVLPSEAVVQDGAEWIVFCQKGSSLEGKPVHVLHRDATSVVVSADSGIKPGTIIARRSAHQLQMALKSQTGSSTDPHAGHSH